MIMEQAVRKEMARFISLSKEYTAWSGRAILHDKIRYTVPRIVVFGKTELIFVQILW